MRRLGRVAALGLVLSAAILAAQQEDMGPAVLDGFGDAEAWRVIAADGVSARVSSVPGVRGQALRLDYEFTKGAGFCVLRRDIAMALPENYRFALAVRGEGPANNFEFKLVDDTGDNVWWVNRRAFAWPGAWQTIEQKARHFTFAWGPSGGARLTRLGAIELAVAAAEGGRGYVIFDELSFEQRPVPEPVTQQPRAYPSSGRATAGAAPVTLGEDGRLDWTSADGDRRPSLRLDFQQMREFGGLAIEWAEGRSPRNYDVQVSVDGERWEPAAQVRGSNGGHDYVPIEGAEGRQVRVDVVGGPAGAVGVRSVRVMASAFGESANEMYRVMAADAPRGRFPRYFVGEQQPWTVVGLAGDDYEALIDAGGAVEVCRGGFRLEPFLMVDGKLVTWAEAKSTQRLVDEYLPLPVARLVAEDKQALEVMPLVVGAPGRRELVIEYRLGPYTKAPAEGELFVAVRPMQVLPPWHQLNLTGGVAKVTSITGTAAGAVVNGSQRIVWTSPARGFGACTFHGGDISDYLARGKLPESASVEDPAGLASAAWSFRGSATVRVLLDDVTPGNAEEATGPMWDAAREAARKQWQEEVTRVGLELPPEARDVEHNFRTVQGHSLINADGPAFQPGSRTYERSWIRDGAITGTAMLYTGHPKRVRAFIEWYGRYLYDNGKVPCVVDRRGPDPVPEHDSTGEFLYLLRTYYQFTGDRALLEAQYANVAAAVGYLETLRAQRMTAEFRDGPPEKRVLYGLVPESISHEGYSAKPMHSYWDGFWVIRGLGDAAAMAETLGRAEDAARFTRLRDEYRAAMYDSIRLAMSMNSVDYVPGCAELGDFDATSTAIGVFPCGELDHAPQPALTRTFERYHEFFVDRRDGRQEWTAYTPYEIRLISTYVRLGWRARAAELLDFFMADRDPPGWNQWGEVVYREPTTPGFVGDMPHTWVGAEFICAVRSMLAYERERDGALVLAAGVPESWLSSERGVAVTGWPTWWGKLSYRLREADGAVVLDLDEAPEAPGGIVLSLPENWTLRGATAHSAPLEVQGNEIMLPSGANHVVVDREVDESE